MNNRGEMNGIGITVVVAITLIVGLIFFQAIAQEVGKSTNTISLANQSLGVMTNGTTLYVTNCRALSGDAAIWNATNNVLIPSNNYTVTSNIVYNGALATSVTPNVSVVAGFAFNKGTATIDGTCQPLNYIADSGGRAMANLIVVMFALAVLVVALTPTLRNGIIDAFGQ
jgi:hypothetical protein